MRALFTVCSKFVHAESLPPAPHK